MVLCSWVTLLPVGCFRLSRTPYSYYCLDRSAGKPLLLHLYLLLVSGNASIVKFSLSVRHCIYTQHVSFGRVRLNMSPCTINSHTAAG